MANFWSELNKPILALAPMAGITDSAFRQICKKYGADVTYSEMASVSALYFKPKKTLDLIRFTKAERSYVVQLFGKHPEHFAKAAKIISTLADNPLSANDSLSGLSARPSARPDGIDINFGCPAKKVFGHGSGCALMPQKELAREIISAVCSNTDLPVSIKIRAGIKGMSAMEFLAQTADLPYSAVMIHGRIYEGGFSGPVNFELISEIKKRFPDKIVLANGGINTPEDAVAVLEKYPNLDGLGIARGAWGRPFIFQEIKTILSRRSGRIYATTTEENNKYDFTQIKKIMIEHAKHIWQDKKELGMLEIRKHLCWYIKGFPGAAELRKRLVLAKSVGEIKKILSEPLIPLSGTD